MARTKAARDMINEKMLFGKYGHWEKEKLSEEFLREPYALESIKKKLKEEAEKNERRIGDTEEH